MLSNHEFVVEVRDKIYPVVSKIEHEVLQMFNRQFCPGRGPTGFRGTNELDWTIDLLGSARTMLIRLGQEQGLLPKEK